MSAEHALWKGEAKKPELTATPQLEAAIRAVASVSKQKKGTVLFRRGDPASGIFLILNGEVTLRLEGQKSIYPARTLGRGAILGLPGTLSGGRYSLAAEVSEDAELAFVSRPDFVALLATDGHLCLEAMNLLGREIASIRSALVWHRSKKSGGSKAQ
ncbi:MAG: Crp/Fnr family transcriptional regulator [Acidobacteriaceae bacterium]|nr:Crp/Fnr family transcriptional regulator [Acidobacteriaceae bacterium]